MRGRIKKEWRKEERKKDKRQIKRIYIPLCWHWLYLSKTICFSFDLSSCFNILTIYLYYFIYIIPLNVTIIFTTKKKYQLNEKRESTLR